MTLWRRCLVLLFVSLPLCAQSTPDAPAKPDPFASIGFLLGTWNATTGAGTADAKVVGTYTFRTDLGGKVVIRTGSADQCKGPADFDCQHQDSLTIYHEMGTPSLQAIYFDNEGHTIHYTVTTPDASTVIFLSNTPGPQFRLVYHRAGDVLSGKFQFAPPGSTEFKSYLEWSGSKL